MSEIVHVVAHFEVSAAEIARFIAAAQRLLVEPTRGERGCLRYELCQDLQQPTRFAMLESWASAADLDSHLAQPGLAAALNELRPCVTAAPQVWRLRPAQA